MDFVGTYGLQNDTQPLDYMYVFLWRKSLASIGFLPGPRKSKCQQLRPQRGLLVTAEVLFTWKLGFHTREQSCKLSLVTITQENPSIHPLAGKCLYCEALGSSDSLKKWQIHVSWLMLTPGHPLVKCVYFLVEGTGPNASEVAVYMTATFPRGRGGKSCGNGRWVLNSNPHLFIK